MSDLISRSELLKEIEKYKFCAISNDIEREYIKNVILNFIEFQPTAYSVDKVVEELESLKDGYDHSCLDNAYERGVEVGAKWMKKKAIEIVKQGGVGKEVE